MATIEIDYEDTIRKAGELERLADDLDRLADGKVQSVLEGAEVSGQWTGSGARMYKKKMITLQSKARTQARQLRSVARNMKSRAERYRKLESLNPFSR